MAKGRLNRHQGKRSSTVVLVLSMLLMLTVVLLMLLALGIFNLPVGSDDESSSSSSSTHDHIKFKRFNLDIGEGDGLGKRGEQWTEILSWEPRAFVYHNFLSKEECEYLINQAKPHMVKSSVVDSKTGQSKDSRVRTSSGMFLRRGRDKVIRNIEKRIADYTFIPAEHGEGLQVLHYEVGQKYEPHYDYFLDNFNTKNGGQRIATLLMYLVACFICLSGTYAVQMLKKGVRLFSQQQRETSVPDLGGMSFQNVPKGASLSNQRWEMLCFSGACGLMLVWIRQVCMVVAL